MTHKLDPIETRYVRFNPQQFQGSVSMRVEVFACPRSKCPRSVSCQRSSYQVYSLLACDRPLGLTTGIIDDHHVSTSSSLVAKSGVRLLSYTTGGAWVSRRSDTLQWVHVNFGHKCRVTGVATQGRSTVGHWVSSYHVEHGNNGHTWTVYRDLRQDIPEVCLFIFMALV